MHLFVTGSSGLIGRSLISILEAAGHQVTRLVRGVPQNNQERAFETGGRRMNPDVLEGCDVLIHLGGESIASGWWTNAKKARIFDSRVDSTAIFSEAITRMAVPPRAFIVASAIGYYGDRGEETLTEQSAAGQGFLSEVCTEWEAAADPAREQTRVVHVRTGMVLSEHGGALKPMVIPFKLGMGGVVGSGRQYWSWVTLKDICRLFAFSVENESIRGPINGVAPNPVTNAEFTRELGARFNRPTFLPVPGFAARLALGEMAKELILASTKVTPQVALEHGFQFSDPVLKTALASLKL